VKRHLTKGKNEVAPIDVTNVEPPPEPVYELNDNLEEKS
jgi:hypothetical protein